MRAGWKETYNVLEGFEGDKDAQRAPQHGRRLAQGRPPVGAELASLVVLLATGAVFFPFLVIAPLAQYRASRQRGPRVWLGLRMDGVVADAATRLSSFSQITERAFLEAGIRSSAGLGPRHESRRIWRDSVERRSTP